MRQGVGSSQAEQAPSEKSGVTPFNVGGVKQSKMGVLPQGSNRELKWSNWILGSHGARVDTDYN